MKKNFLAFCKCLITGFVAVKTQRKIDNITAYIEQYSGEPSTGQLHYWNFVFFNQYKSEIHFSII